MRIGIDARCLEGRRTGVGRYLINLLRRWGETAPDNVYYLYTKREVPDDDFLAASCFVRKTVGNVFIRKGPLWEQFALKKAASKDAVDVFFAPAYTAPLRLKCPLVVAIHDVSYETHPEGYPFLLRSYFRFMSRRAAAFAAIVITDSEEARREIVKHYALAEDKIKVIPLAADTAFTTVKDLTEIETTKRGLGISGRYLLYVGMIFTRRNIPKLLEAFSLVKEKAPDFSLVIIGENETEPKIDISALINSLGLAENVIWREYVSQHDVVNLYNGTEAFIYLSAYEGFGLPVLEAMQCGAPVIVADKSCLPELVGDAALLVDPDDAREIESAIVRLLNEDGLRDGLKKHVLERAKKFSWDATAQTTLDIIESSTKRTN